MSKIVDIDERSFKEKVEWKIYNAKCRAKNVCHWVKEHPTQTMIIVTTAVGAISEVRRTGAWLAMQNLTWDGSYVLEYDVDVSQLAKDAFVAFDSGEQTAWQDLHLSNHCPHQLPHLVFLTNRQMALLNNLLLYQIFRAF